MKKIINAPQRFVDDMLEGIMAAHPDWLTALDGDNRTLIRKTPKKPGQVAIVTGGGSGHLPVFMGYVGHGLADGVAVGNVFASPSSRQIFAVTRALDSGAGVLHLYGNYQGDILHFETAAELADAADIRVTAVRASDDVASAPSDQWETRRGIAGIFFAYKLAGAKAAEGADLDEVTAIAADAVANTRSMGVALGSCTVPEIGAPNFAIADDEMEIGMGLHGEPGLRRGPLLGADEIARTLVGAILDDLPFHSGDRVAVLVNGLGATPVEELYILYRSASQMLADNGIGVHRCYVGEYATSLEMAGASISLLRLDDERIRLLDSPASSPFFTQQ